MPKCKNDPTKYYHDKEPSPRGVGYYAGADAVGTQRLGRDGNVWQVVQFGLRQIKRWTKVKPDSRVSNKYVSPNKTYQVEISIYRGANTNRLKQSLEDAMELGVCRDKSKPYDSDSWFPYMVELDKSQSLGAQKYKIEFRTIVSDMSIPNKPCTPFELFAGIFYPDANTDSIELVDP